MQRSHLSKVIGTGVLLAGFAVLPLAAPTAVRSEDMRGMSNYEMGRHVKPEAMREGEATSTRQGVMYSDNSSTQMMMSNSSPQMVGRMMMENQDRYFQGMSNYEMGRHVLPEPMRMNSSEMMMRRQTMQSETTMPSRQSSEMMQQNMPGSTMQPGGTMQQDMPSGTMQPGGTMQQDMPSGTMQPGGTMQQDMPSGTMQPNR